MLSLVFIQKLGFAIEFKATKHDFQISEYLQRLSIVVDYYYSPDNAVPAVNNQIK
jgi:hypothetical protein